MLILYCLSWWYGRGWKWRLRKSGESIVYWAEYFSIGKLFTTLFSPYRQTFAGGKGSQAVIDNLISRFVGFFVRFFIIIAASIMLLGYGLLTFASILLWPLVPLMPLIALVLIVMGAKL